MSRYTPVYRTGCTHHYHDTSSAYRTGCRCPKARDAYRIYQKRLRHGRPTGLTTPVQGIQRRIRALCAMGYPMVHQARFIGWNTGDLHPVLQQRVTRVSTDLAARIAAMFDELAMTPGPSEHARKLAAAKGWPPPLAWDDIDNDIAPAVVPIGCGKARGNRHPLEINEIRHLLYGGCSVEETSRRLGVTAAALEQCARRQGDRPLLTSIQARMRTYERRDSA